MEPQRFLSGAFMSTGPTFWLIMTVGGAVLLGVALAYGLISTRKRRENPVAQRLTDAATREVYREEEDRRVREEGGAGEAIPERSVTEARQAVSGHHVNIVLGASLVLAAVAALGLLTYVWILRG
jgi:hypothetical protein